MAQGYRSWSKSFKIENTFELPRIRINDGRILYSTGLSHFGRSLETGCHHEENDTKTTQKDHQSKEEQNRFNHHSKYRFRCAWYFKIFYINGSLWKLIWYQHFSIYINDSIKFFYSKAIVQLCCKNNSRNNFYFFYIKIHLMI